MLLLNPILTHLELRIIVSINQSATLMPGVACRAIHDRKQSISKSSIHLVMPLLVPIFSVLHHHLWKLSSSAKSIFNFPLVASTSIYVSSWPWCTVWLVVRASEHHCRLALWGRVALELTLYPPAFSSSFLEDLRYLAIVAGKHHPPLYLGVCTGWNTTSTTPTTPLQSVKVVVIIFHS